MKSMLGGVRAAAKQLAYYRMRDVVRQVNQGQPHFLLGVEPAAAPTAHRALALRAVRGLPPMPQLRQHLREQCAQGAEVSPKSACTFSGA